MFHSVNLQAKIEQQNTSSFLRRIIVTWSIYDAADSFYFINTKS